MKKIRFPLILSFVWIFSIASAHAQCDPVNAIENCTVNELQRTLGNRAREELRAKNRQAAQAVINTNRATTAPDPFAARLHASYQDFLVPLSFAISSIEESKDGRSLIVRLNPFRKTPSARGFTIVGGFTITASKPDLDARIAEAIPEDVRDTELKRLSEDIDDLGDLTFSGSVSAETADCKDDGKWCWGRNPRAYGNVLGAALLSLVPPASSTEADDAFLRLDGLLQAINADFDTKLFNVPADQRASIIAAAREAVAADLRDRETYLKLLDDLGIDHLASLIDNQPQLSFTASWRDRDDIAGPTEAAATLEFQFGLHNFNRLKRHCPKPTLNECVGDSLKAIDSGTRDVTDKFVLTASLKDTASYSLSADDIVVPGFVPIDVPRIREFSAKLQWGQRLQPSIAGQRMRLDFNAEGIRVTADGKETKNDWIGTATLTVPVASNISIPISLKYGNRPDLIRDVDKHWGAHLGISYRLPFGLSGS